ncbi:MAG TPA: hypothetical protein VII38_11170, partial [Polyangia bacterium]
MGCGGGGSGEWTWGGGWCSSGRRWRLRSLTGSLSGYLIAGYQYPIFGNCHFCQRALETSRYASDLSGLRIPGIPRGQKGKKGNTLNSVNHF